MPNETLTSDERSENPWINNWNDFEKDLTGLINRYSMEQLSSTPDFILAKYLVGCLAAFNVATTTRAKWYGREAGKPGCLEQPVPTGGAAGSQHAVHTRG